MPVISTNLAANSAVRYLNINSALQTSSLSKLASGSRITQASDDAAGLAISTKISSDVTALNQAATNASHGISVLQTADGGASNISDILQRMKALASQASSGTVTDNERVYIDAEFQQLIQEIDAISTGSRYNGQSLLDGTSAFAAGINVMVGSDAADIIKISLDKLTSQGLGLKTTDGIADTGVKGNKDPQVDAALVLTLPNTLTMPATLDFKINGIDMQIVANAATGVAGTATADYVAQINAKLTAAVGEDFTVANVGNVFTFTATAGSFGKGALQVSDLSNNKLTDAAAATLGFNKALSQGTGGVTGTTANLYIDTTITVATGTTLAIKINGIDISIVGNANTQAGGAAGMNDIAAQIAAQLAVVDGEDFVVSHLPGANDIVITSASQGGQLTVTNATGGALTPAELTALSLSDSATYIPAEVTGVAVGTYGTVNDSPAFLVGGSSTTITDDKVTFEVNNVTVTLTNTGGSTGNGIYTTKDLVDTINAALLANNVKDVKASIRGGNLAIATTTVGAEAKVEVDNFSTGTSQSILGMSPVATGVVAGEGQGTALKAGMQSAATQAGAVKALDVVDAGISQVSKARANIGSLESRFGFHQASIATSVENLTAAVSAIKDTDIAQEAAKLASVKVKTQAAVAAAAQASQMPQDLLKLLQ